MKARYLLGKTYLKTGKLLYAEKELGKAYKFEADNDEYRLSYARILLLNQKYKKAMYLLEGEVSDPGLEGDRLSLLGSIAYDKKQYKQAENYFRQSEEIGNIKANIGLANIALYKKNLQEADAYIENVIKLEPDNISALKVKALILNLSQRYQQALEIYTKLINKQPNNDDLYLQRAATLITLNNLSEAEKDINLILKKYSTFPLANYLMAKLRFEEKDYKQAEIFSQKVLNINSRDKASIFISGASNLALNKLYLAEKRFLEYLSLEPDNIDVQILLAKVYLAMNRAESAILILEELPESHRNNNIAALETLTIAYLAMGDLEKAVNNLQQAQKDVPGNKKIQKILVASKNQVDELNYMIKGLDTHNKLHKKAKKEDYLQLVSYFQQHNSAKFKEKLAQFVSNTPEDPNLYILGAKFELSNNNTSVARQFFNKALKYDNQYIPALAGLAKMAFNDKDYQLSQIYYQQIISIDKKHIPSYLALSQLTERRDNLLSAENYLQQIYAINKGNVTNEIKLAIVLIDFFDRHNMPDKKERIINDLVKNNPDNLKILSSVFNLYYKGGLFQQAEKTLRTMINKDSDNANYRLWLASLLSKQQAYKEETLKAWDTAFAFNEKNPDILVAKHSYQLQYKQYKAALLTAKQVKNKFPNLNLAELLEGNTYLLSGKTDLALDSFQKAFQIQADAKLAIRIADVMIMQGAVNDAVQFLQKQLVTQFIDSYPILFHLAELQQARKHYPQAIEYYQRLLKLRPEQTSLLNNLAWIYMLTDDPKAVALAEKAYKKQPDSADFADTYGVILLKNNKLNKAISVLNEAVNLAPDNKDIQYHLAKAYYLQGDNDKALSILEKITQGKEVSAEQLLLKLQ